VHDAYFGPSDFVDLIHRAQLELTGSEIVGYLNYSYSFWMKTMTGPDLQSGS